MQEEENATMTSYEMLDYMVGVNIDKSPLLNENTNKLIWVSTLDLLKSLE